MEHIIIHHTPEQTRGYQGQLNERAAALANGEKATDLSPIRALVDECIPKQVTIAACQEEGKLHIAYAACSWSDNFSRKTGRNIACGRLGKPGKESSGRYKTIDIANPMDAKDIVNILRAEATAIVALEEAKSVEYLHRITNYMFG